MAKRQAVIFVHGIGKQQSGYSHEARQAIEQWIRSYLEKRVPQVEMEAFVFEEVLWSPVTDGVESELWYRLRRSADLDQKKLRRFVVEFLGDVLAYQPTAHSERSNAYVQIHEVLNDAVDRLEAENQSEGLELTFVAHSLGSVVVSDFLYDHQQEFQAVNLFTLGSPLALWTLIHGDPDKAACPARVAEPHGVWINILDDDDIVGYPLRGVNRHYRRAVHRDYVTEIGAPVLRHSVASHTAYWTDGNVVKPIARKLADDYLRLRRLKYPRRSAYLKFIDGLWNI